MENFDVYTVAMETTECLHRSYLHDRGNNRETRQNKNDLE